LSFLAVISILLSIADSRLFDRAEKPRNRVCYGTDVAKLEERFPAGERSSLFVEVLSGGAELLSESWCAEDVDDALEVVGHDGDGDLGLCSLQTARQQTRVAEDTVFEGAEGVFYR
jgi:hypothetical protein